jgi:hypothetical protein
MTEMTGAGPVLFATVRPFQHDDTAPRIAAGVPSRCTDLFNVGYEVLLQMLHRYFAHAEETDAQLTTLSRAAIALMVGVLKPLGDMITTLPVGPEHPGMTAGASFELFYENDYLMPHRDPSAICFATATSGRCRSRSISPLTTKCPRTPRRSIQGSPRAACLAMAPGRRKMSSASARGWTTARRRSLRPSPLCSQNRRIGVRWRPS